MFKPEKAWEIIKRNAEKALELINAGGREKIGKLITPSVAAETAFVFFHHQLGWSKDGEFIKINL